MKNNETKRLIIAELEAGGLNFEKSASDSCITDVE